MSQVSQPYPRPPQSTEFEDFIKNYVKACLSVTYLRDMGDH